MLITVLVMAGIFYYNADPQQMEFMPRCFMKMITGYQCPACGAQRSFHALLHGHLLQALSYNYFFVFSVPFLFIAIFASCKIKTGHPSKSYVTLYNFITHRYMLLFYVILFFAWWIVRNIFGC